MSEGTRVAVVLGVLLLAGLAGWLARRTGSPRRVLESDHGPFPAVFFFGSESCRTCRPAWEAVLEADLSVRQYTWEDDRSLFEAWDIDEVPLLWVIDQRGRVREEVPGVPDARALRRAKSQVARE